MSIASGYDASISPIDTVVTEIERGLKNTKDFDVIGLAGNVLKTAMIMSGSKLPISQPVKTAKGAMDLYNGETGDLRRLIWSKHQLFQD